LVRLAPKTQASNQNFKHTLFSHEVLSLLECPQLLENTTPAFFQVGPSSQVAFQKKSGTAQYQSRVGHEHYSKWLSSELFCFRFVRSACCPRRRWWSRWRAVQQRLEPHPQVPVPDVKLFSCRVPSPKPAMRQLLDSEDYRFTVAGTNKQDDGINTTLRSKATPFTILDISLSGQ
jgi:hypothetical protein